MYGTRRAQEIINLTGEHMVGVSIGDCIHNIPFSGISARVRFDQEIIDSVLIGGRRIPIVRNVGAVVKNLPKVEEGVYYITSRLVAEYVKRPDVLAPNKNPGHVIRDAFGSPVAVDSFITFI